MILLRFWDTNVFWFSAEPAILPVSIAVPNAERSVVNFRDSVAVAIKVISAANAKEQIHLPLNLGVDEQGQPVVEEPDKNAPPAYRRAHRQWQINSVTFNSRHDSLHNEQS